MDIEGAVVIPIIYDVAGDFYSDICLVTIDGKCYYIDRKGDFVKNCH
ncbi:MAG: WG repeat-containing protein [Saprospiraceae bacterium]|nr:WG repeat-containing protein [Candidatus Brachybacter algidus]